MCEAITEIIDPDGESRYLIASLVPATPPKRDFFPVWPRGLTLVLRTATLVPIRYPAFWVAAVTWNPTSWICPRLLA